MVDPVAFLHPLKLIYSSSIRYCLSFILNISKDGTLVKGIMLESFMLETFMSGHLQWLTLTARIQLKLLIRIYRSYLDLAPKYACDPIGRPPRQPPFARSALLTALIFLFLV